MTHSPEPWNQDGHTIENEGGLKNLGHVNAKHPQALANAARIVACVNACRGIETEILVSKADIINKGLERMTDILRRE